MIKIGDAVVIRKSEGSFYSVGAMGKIVDIVSDECVRVRFTSGKYDHDCESTWYVHPDDCEKVVPYHETFTSGSTPASGAGHRADGGGFQNHSVGGAYPIAVVGYGVGSRTVFSVENLEQGTVAGTLSGAVRCWSDVRWATDYLQSKLLTDKAEEVVWLKGRPVADDYGFLTMPVSLPRKVYGVAVPTDASPTTWYYMHLEQDIG